MLKEVWSQVVSIGRFTNWATNVTKLNNFDFDLISDLENAKREQKGKKILDGRSCEDECGR